jgi:hypothetical protein
MSMISRPCCGCSGTGPEAESNFISEDDTERALRQRPVADHRFKILNIGLLLMHRLVGR